MNGIAQKPDGAVVARDLQALDQRTRKQTIREMADCLPVKERRELARELAQPTDRTRDVIWLIVVSAFALVLVGAFITIAVSAFWQPIDTTQAASLEARVQIILTLFTTAGAFLAGLLSPSPLQQGSGEAGQGGGS